MNTVPPRPGNNVDDYTNINTWCRPRADKQNSSVQLIVSVRGQKNRTDSNNHYTIKKSNTIEKPLLSNYIRILLELFHSKKYFGINHFQ